MDGYLESKLKHFPAVPPEGERLTGVYQRPTGNWYFSARDPKRVAKGLKPQFTHTTDTYWQAADALRTFRGLPTELSQSAPVPAVARNGAPVKIDARGRHMPAFRKPEMRQSGAEVSIAAMLGQYEKFGPVAPSDIPMVRGLARSMEGNVSDITSSWAMRWVAVMKKEMVKPGTIKKKVESLGRALEWHHNDTATRQIESLGGGQDVEKAVWAAVPRNPLKSMPKKYHTYKDGEVKPGTSKPKDMKRNRRLYGDEYATIRAAITSTEKPFVVFKGATTAEDREGLDVLFQLIVNSAMRLREAYSLKFEQLHFDGKRSMIVLPPEVTKTDAGRTIPMTPAMFTVLKKWIGRPGAKRGHGVPIFPMFWDGDDGYFAMKRASERLSSIFARLFEAAGIAGLREHDLRHEGTCRWVEMKLPDGRPAYTLSECMKWTGHMTEAMFFRYASLRGSEAAERLYAENHDEMEVAEAA